MLEPQRNRGSIQNLIFEAGYSVPTKSYGQVTLACALDFLIFELNAARRNMRISEGDLDEERGQGP
jgi:hypothetical protein